MKVVCSMNDDKVRNIEFTSVKSYTPYHSEFDPCPSIGKKYYFTPPNLYIGFQQPGLEQYTPREALRKGTLWPLFYDDYKNPYKK